MSFRGLNQRFPSYRDKVEFEIIHSCYVPDLPERLKPLLEHGFSPENLSVLAESLRVLTNNIIHRETGLWKTDIGIVRGYLAEAFRIEARYFENARWRETNMVMSLAAAREWLQADMCVISYSDIVYDRATVAALLGVSADIAITYDANWLELWRARFPDPLSDAETFVSEMTACSWRSAIARGAWKTSRDNTWACSNSRPQGGASRRISSRRKPPEAVTGWI